MRFEHIRGLVAAPFTPMNDDASVNLDAVEPYAEMLVANGVRGVFVCGSTGEGLSLTVGERMDVAKRWRDAAGDGLKVLVNVSHDALGEARALASHAAQIGADAIGGFGPVYLSCSTVEDLATWCAAVASAAPETPYYYYHIPSRTHVDLPIADLFRAAEGRMPTLAGAKFTYENLWDFARCVEMDDGRYNMLFGRDEMLLAALPLGARGAVGSTYNFQAPLYRRLLDAYAAGDVEEARKAQRLGQEVIGVGFRRGGLRAFKHFMAMIGVDCGPPRLPMRPLDDADVDAMRNELDELGFFDFCCQR